jgi:hypothetical protein
MRKTRLLFGTIGAAALLPGRAFADAAIDGAVKPYFVLGGWLAALVFLGIGSFLLAKALRYPIRARIQAGFIRAGYMALYMAWVD